MFLTRHGIAKDPEASSIPTSYTNQSRSILSNKELFSTSGTTVLGFLAKDLAPDIHQILPRSDRY